MSAISKPFCSFCKHLGKSEAEYTSHYVKDKIGGAVVCPELLANECGYCHDHGHTPKFCPKLKARDERRARKLQQAMAKGWVTPGRGSQERTFLSPPTPPASPAEGPTRADLDALRAQFNAVKAELEAAEAVERLSRLSARRAPVTNADDVASAEIDRVGGGNQEEYFQFSPDEAQSDEQTAEGEAFFDNVADAEDAAVAIASSEVPTTVCDNV